MSSTAQVEAGAGAEHRRNVLQTEHNVNAAIGIRLRALRGSAPRHEFAPTIGVSVMALRRYDAGERPLDAQVVVAICRRYGVDPRWLLLGEGQPPPVTIHDTQPSPPASHET